MNQNNKLESARQTAILFASICCTAAAVALAAPAFAAADEPMPATTASEAEVASPSAGMATPRAEIAIPETVDPLPFLNKQLKSADLKPGEFIWREDVPKGAEPVRLLVSISDQRAYVYRGETLVAVSTVSTGKPGHATPTGTFPIKEKRAVHFSNKYNNAPMPHMQRLTNDGIALHAGHIPGHPASHGCVRLPGKFAAALFEVTQRGTAVTITL